MYTCEICGKKYDNLKDRANCELKCFTDREAAEEKKRKMEKKRKQTESEKVVLELLTYADETLHNHIETYGTITINEDFPYLRYIFGNSKFWF